MVYSQFSYIWTPDLYFSMCYFNLNVCMNIYSQCYFLFCIFNPCSRNQLLQISIWWSINLLITLYFHHMRFFFSFFANILIFWVSVLPVSFLIYCDDRNFQNWILILQYFYNIRFLSMLSDNMKIFMYLRLKLNIS